MDTSKLEPLTNIFSSLTAEQPRAEHQQNSREHHARDDCRTTSSTEQHQNIKHANIKQIRGVLGIDYRFDLDQSKYRYIDVHVCIYRPTCLTMDIHKSTDRIEISMCIYRASSCDILFLAGQLAGSDVHDMIMFRQVHAITSRSRLKSSRELKNRHTIIVTTPLERLDIQLNSTAT